MAPIKGTVTIVPDRTVLLKNTITCKHGVLPQELAERMGAFIATAFGDSVYAFIFYCTVILFPEV